jgi:NAD(P)-dependent dehydrogenase (short-subunit alcohol dehydrogenase family)
LRKNSSEEVSPDGGYVASWSKNGRLIGLIGFQVIATARSDAVVQHLTNLGYFAVQLDVTDAASIDRCREVVVGLTGARLNILVNNA